MDLQKWVCPFFFFFFCSGLRSLVDNIIIAIFFCFFGCWRLVSSLSCGFDRALFYHGGALLILEFDFRTLEIVFFVWWFLECLESLLFVFVFGSVFHWTEIELLLTQDGLELISVCVDRGRSIKYSNGLID